MKSLHTWLFLFILLTVVSPGFAASDERIDQVLVKHLDVTGDGIDDEIRLDIKGENWNTPLRWTLTISSKDKILFKHSADDSWLDKFFNDSGYVNDTCKSYLDCKKQYYMKDLLDHLFVRTDLSPNFHAYDKSNSGSVYAVAKAELQNKFKLSEEEANKAVDWMVSKLKTGKVQVLYVPKSPVQSEFPRMYVDRVGQFVTIYEW
jgi:hypothetical protein